MKKTLYTLLAGAMALSSCSKSDDMPMLPQSGEQTATFTIEAPAATRATVDGLSRYIVEAYEGKDLTTTPVRVEAATGSLTLELKKNTDYTFVFWADKGTIAATDNYYDVSKLQDVKVNPSAYATPATPAYCLAVSFNSKDFEANKSVVLKNATAQLTFTEAAGLQTADNSLTVNYSSGGKLNVATGKITEIGSEISRTYTNIGKIAKDGIVATDYILAPQGEKRLLDLKVTFNSEPEKSITGVPFQQSYKTSVKGEFSNLYESKFTVSDQVEDYENNPDVEFPIIAKVGDFFYQDKTYSSTYTADAQNPCIGIVFAVNADGTSGKIVGLTEPEADWNGGTNAAGKLTWGQAIITNAIDEENGATNMATIKALDPTLAAYPAFAWAESQNTHAIAGISWYLPAKNELVAIYGTDGATVRIVNGSLKAASKTPLSTVSTDSTNPDYYWSSTVTANNLNFAKYVRFDYGYDSFDPKNTSYRVRVVSAF